MACITNTGWKKSPREGFRIAQCIFGGREVLEFLVFQERLSCTACFHHENGCHYLKKRFGIPWLREECDETCLEGPAIKPILRAICGYGYNWNPLAVTICVDRPSRLITIHVGHVEVH